MWYMLIRQIIPNRWVGAALTCVLLTDVGLLGNGLVFRQAQSLARLLAGSLKLVDGPYVHAEWRVATPALTHFYLLLNLWLTLRARERPTAIRLVLAGVSLGLLFHVYPYYWTNACAASRWPSCSIGGIGRCISGRVWSGH